MGSLAALSATRRAHHRNSSIVDGTFPATDLYGELYSFGKHALTRWLPLHGDRVLCHKPIPGELQRAGGIFARVTSSGLEAGPTGEPFFRIKTERMECFTKAYLSDLQPAPEAVLPARPCVFHSGDWVRITAKEFVLAGQVHRIRSTWLDSQGKQWIDLGQAGHPLEGGDLEHWSPQINERVVHPASGVRTSIRYQSLLTTHTDTASVVIRNPINGVSMVLIRDLEPDREPGRPVRVGSRWLSHEDESEQEVVGLAPIDKRHTLVTMYKINVGIKVSPISGFHNWFTWKCDP